MLRRIKQVARILLGHRSQRLNLDKLDIGSGTRISQANLDGMFPELAHIGKNCIFAPQSMVLTHDASYLLYAGKYRIAPVWIGDEVFVGYGTIIMPGIRIGDRVVVGAGTVVTRDIPDNSVVAGIPARVLCSLDEYLAKQNTEYMFTPPFFGSSPVDINMNDVEHFRNKVYQAMKSENDGTC